MVRDPVDAVDVDTFDMHEVKTQLARILEKVQAGAEVTIAKAGEPIARIVPIRPARLRTPDTKKGLLWVAEDFDAPLPHGLFDAFADRR